MSRLLLSIWITILVTLAATNSIIYAQTSNEPELPRAFLHSTYPAEARFISPATQDAVGFRMRSIALSQAMQLCCHPGLLTLATSLCLIR